MNPRTPAVVIIVAAAVAVVGFALWLAQPAPEPDLLPSASEAPSRPAPPSPETRTVTLSTGELLPEVPVNCEPDDAGSLSCRDLCVSDADCPPMYLCAADFTFGYRDCLPESYFCIDIQDCPEGQDCLAVTSSASGAELRRCFPRGQRRAGERCDEYLRGDRFCEAGLTCTLGVCGPFCDVRLPASCPEGWECVPDRYRVYGGCVPSCRDRPCPEGQSCQSLFGGGVPMCIRAIGRDCLEHPCPEGQNCLMGFTDASREMLAFECRERCQGTRCPRGRTCDAQSGLCYRPCTQEAECAAPERCAPIHEGSADKGCVLLANGLF